MKKTIVILLLFISAISYAQSYDRATNLAVESPTSVRITNKQTCPTNYKISYGDTTFTSVMVLENSVYILNIPSCLTVKVTPLINCGNLSPVPKEVSICTCSVLAVGFKSVDAQRQGDGSVKVLFQMSDQTNVKEYIIMTSEDGKTFTPKYSVPVNSTLSYPFNFKQ